MSDDDDDNDDVDYNDYYYVKGLKLVYLKKDI